jgi:hypothetical protein
LLKPALRGVPLGIDKHKVMAIVASNDILFGLRGRVGDFVFRRVYGKTVVSRRPGKQDPAKQSEGRKKTRSDFKEAVAWATSVLRDPLQKAYYKQRAREWNLTNAYIAAIKDHMRNPAVKQERKAISAPAGKPEVSLHETRVRILKSIGKKCAGLEHTCKRSMVNAQMLMTEQG